MDKTYRQQVVKQLNYSEKQINQVLDLLAEGNTVPFIARYRKEMTGSLDELQIREIASSYDYTKNLGDRKETVLKAIADQDKLTPELKTAIEEATLLQRVEDLYAPYKQKRQTKASIAKEQGIEPLARWLFTSPKTGNVANQAQAYINEDLPDIQSVLDGAHEIMCEWISEDANVKSWLRNYVFNQALIVTKKSKRAEDPKAVYGIYYDFSAKFKDLKPYQVLAINRGKKEKVLTVKLDIDDFPIVNRLVNRYVKGHPVSIKQMQAAIQDAVERFLLPQSQRDLHKQVTAQAEDHAIEIFANNLWHLLMQSPLKGKTVLGLDPAFRTGCKLAVLDETGRVLTKTVIYPHQPINKVDQAKQTVLQLVKDYGVDMVAIGNGTASRESEAFIAELISENDLALYYSIVNESGASVYSASDIAREEFPDYNVEERSAVSIGRRLQDPLAELVKIDPQAIGVGQYQHDVSQKQLAERLDFTVETVVNRVGVDVNTASVPLLEHVAGLTKTVAKNIVNFRNDKGQFTNRKQLQAVKQMGPKTFEQAAGFLRVLGGDTIYDQTGIHPENYNLVDQILNDLAIDPNNFTDPTIKEILTNLDIKSAAASYGIGEESLTDIIDALLQPGRDPRDEVAAPLLRQDVLAISDLTVGMALQGTVRNVVDFGAFVDIGVKEDGLVHISKLSEKFVKNPLDVVSVGDIVDVWVSEVDMDRGRIGLSMIPLD
ncbi:Tex family protein [Aerococcus kribbianus]|uniref:Tex family protein n=1 Tax=Aerococcus kribbianus TaxID=2999064 RepID=A0A9X3FRH7_9LACT|nr:MULTISPECIES: Tex family protein [unclassified Aerococcus]MCZ0716987.1 Tex family protein [Aerococcus sp. YH-aer221]MCZ0725275.1 Tex family protein [Aerococcus sp. YH-aer222]